jgi:hypothetical protein
MDFYELLNVPRTATADELKHAYKVLAVKWHPDKHPVETKNEAEKKMKEINEAYSVLSDFDKRRKYDKINPVRVAKKKKASKPRPPINPEERMEWIKKNDPNFGRGTIVDSPAPKVDVWGQPIAPRQQEQWKQSNREIPKPPKKKPVLKEKDMFIDTHKKYYVDDAVPNLRSPQK